MSTSEKDLGRAVRCGGRRDRESRSEQGRATAISVGREGSAILLSARNGSGDFTILVF